MGSWITSDGRPINKVMEKRLKAAEMWFFRKMLRISWVQKVRNGEVLKKVNHTVIM